MRLSPSGTLTAFFLVATAAACLSQEPPPAHPTSDALTLNVVVTPGKHGDPVAGLPQSSFTVLDNGAPQPIQSFRAVSGQTEPVKILLVIDTVNAPYTRVAYEREQIDHYLSANDGKLAQPTALAIFTDTGTKLQPGFSTDGNAMRQELDKQTIGLRDIRRDAGFYGAEERLDLSLKTLSQLLARASSEPGRKFIVWVTPGWPLLGGPNLQLTAKEEQNIFAQVVAYSNELRRSNTTLYTVDPLGAGESPGRAFYYEEYVKGLKKPTNAEPADLGVQVLSEQSGGAYLTGSNDVSALLARATADARAQYQIQYKPPVAEAPNEYHHIEVKLSDNNLKARTLEGYYGQPNP